MKQNRLPPWLALFVMMLGPYLAVEAAITESWLKQYSDSEFSEDRAQDVAIDRHGNVIVTGWVRSVPNNADYFTVKYAADDGRMLWSRHFDSPFPSDDFGTAVAVDAQGDVIVTGSARSNTVYVTHTLKYSGSDGSELWHRTLAGPVGIVAVDKQGNALLGGRSFSAKLAATNGAVVWEERRTNNVWDYSNAIVADDHGDVVVSRFSGTYFQTTKRNGATGAAIWEITEPDLGLPALIPDASRLLALDGNQDAIICQLEYPPAQTFIAKLAGNDGTTIWRTYLTNFFFIRIRALALDPAGNICIAGDYGYTAKLSGTNGQILWEQLYNGQVNHGVSELHGVEVDKSGNLTVVGYSIASFEEFEYTYFLYTGKYSGTNGAILWENQRSDPINEVGLNMALRPDGNLVVSAWTAFNEANRYDFLTILYAPFLPRLSVEPIGSGVRLQFPGTAGRTYEIQHAPSLNGSWNTLLITNASVGGLIVHTNTTVGPGGFFRVSAAP